jgi:26S proteasome regulatory subunit N2
MLQAIGLALSLRRLDLIEMIFLSSRASQASTSTDISKNVAHDESLLRYVLAEVVSGTSGNENWPPEFRERVSYGTCIVNVRLTACSFSLSYSAFSTSAAVPIGTQSRLYGFNPATTTHVGKRSSDCWARTRYSTLTRLLLT